MKKSNWLCGIAYVVAGIIFLLIGIFTDTKLDSLMFGFAGAGIIPGMVMIYKYFYWNSPNNVERYKEKLEAENIELHDELMTFVNLAFLDDGAALTDFSVLTGYLFLCAYPFTRFIIKYASAGNLDVSFGK